MSDLDAKKFSLRNSKSKSDILPYSWPCVAGSQSQYENYKVCSNPQKHENFLINTAKGPRHQ